MGTSASLLLLSSDEEENTGEETTHPPADTVVETPATDVCDATTSHVTINSAPQHKRKSISSSGPMPKCRTRQNTKLPEWNKDHAIHCRTEAACEGTLYLHYHHYHNNYVRMLSAECYNSTRRKRETGETVYRDQGNSLQKFSINLAGRGELCVGDLHE